MFSMAVRGCGARRPPRRCLVLPSLAVQTEYEYDTSWFGEFGIAPLDGLLLTTSFQEGSYDANLTARYVGKLPNSHYYAGSVTIEDRDGG